MNLVSLALAVFNVLNWILKKIDNAEWKRQGKLELLNEQRKEYDATMSDLDNAIAKAETSTPDERRVILKGDL